MLSILLAAVFAVTTPTTPKIDPTLRLCAVAYIEDLKTDKPGVFLAHVLKSKHLTTAERKATKKECAMFDEGAAFQMMVTQAMEQHAAIEAMTADLPEQPTS